MKKLFFTLLLICNFATLALANWKEVIEQKKILMDEKTYNLIVRQYNSYKENKLPKIAADEIKNIPIRESGENVIDLKEIKNNSRIRMLPNPETPFCSPDCNSGLPSASKVRINLYNKMTNMLNQLDKLASHFGFKPGQVSITVFEGLRDLKTQKMLFEHKAKEILSLNPNLSEDEVFQETAKWVSPVKGNVPVHSTGGAVDIRLFDEDQESFIDMGAFGTLWRINEIAPTFSESITPGQMANRLFLIMAATQSELINYPYEFWHFSTGDRYAAYWLESSPLKREALYNSVKN